MRWLQPQLVLGSRPYCPPVEATALPGEQHHLVVVAKQEENCILSFWWDEANGFLSAAFDAAGEVGRCSRTCLISRICLYAS